jgi:GT2 family glycosyltransferase
MMPQLSIVIVSYNVIDFLYSCIASIQRSPLVTEVIVVDNNSSDGSVEMIPEKFPFVELIINRENKGFSGANNQGIALATSDNILLLNPDTELKDGSLEKMISYLQTQSELCIIGPKLINSDGSLQLSCLNFPNVFSIIAEAFYLHFLFSSKKYFRNKMKNIFNADAMSGAALLFRKELVNKVGFLDENLFWMEDVDLCYRNKNINGLNIYFPDAEIVHHSGQSAKKNYNISISNQLISKLKFFRKHKKYLSFFFSAIFIFIHIISRIIIFGCMSLFSTISRKKCNAYSFSFVRFFTYLFNGNKSII